MTTLMHLLHLADSKGSYFAACSDELTLQTVDHRQWIKTGIH